LAFSAKAIFVLAALAAVALLSKPGTAPASPPDGETSRVFLHADWKLQSSCDAKASGEKISAAGFSAEGWHSTSVPSTVLAALVADKTYPDPYFGMNLRSIPGTTYGIGKNFSNLAMPKDSPFYCSWWYRTEFQSPPNIENRHAYLHFGGINYRANVWLNGKKVADEKEIAGAYRTYEFDVTPYLVPGQTNVLAVETYAQTEKDLGINWVDWNPTPPDKDLGLWGDVYLDTSGPVAIRHTQVVTHFADLNDLSQADLTIETELRNSTKVEVSGTLSANFDDVRFTKNYTLKPGEVRDVRLTASDVPGLHVKNPKLWWPYQMGSQDLHALKVNFQTGSDTSDEETIRFGMREITAGLDEQKHLVFRINGKKILIRGGGWAPDMLLRQSQERLEDEFRYVRDMNLNTIRLEGKLESEAFYDLADEQGVLIMAGWCCCDHWEQWSKWKPGDLDVATESLGSQILRMRSHPSILVWLNGSDGPPPANVESAYIKVLKSLDWPNPYLSSASQKPAAVTGPSGVKMTGPYDHVPPDYWLTDTAKYGGAFGLNTETGPGPAIPPVSCLKRFLPEEDIRPEGIVSVSATSTGEKQSNPVWNYHAGSEGFKNLSHFEGAMDAMYGVPISMADYQRKAQLMAYDGERAMFEAYSSNKYTSTGVIQWMLNNAWPSLIWHLYDYYLQPAGGYFGAKKALEPLHVLFTYNDRGVVLVNSRYQDFSGLKVTATLYDFGLRQRFSREVQTSIDSDGVKKVLAIPAESFSPPSPVYFVKLDLTDAEGKLASTNFYALSARQNNYKWHATDYKYTPVSSYEDLTALQNLPQTEIKVSASIERSNAGKMVRVKLQNPSANLAFQIHLGVHPQGTQEEILPVLWSDNYIELLPGESRELAASYARADALPDNAVLEIDGWNVAPATIPLSPSTATAHESGEPSTGNGWR
jgi:exo-1,4-beta-D-glucosaminidase